MSKLYEIFLHFKIHTANMSTLTKVEACMLITVLCCFGHVAWPVGSQFPDQGLNLDHSSKCTES